MPRSRVVTEEDKATMRALRPTHRVSDIVRAFNGRYTYELVHRHTRHIHGPVNIVPDSRAQLPTPLWEQHAPEPYIHNAGLTSEWDRMTAAERRCVR